MKALYYERFGPPEVLRLGERPEPPPRAGLVRVRVEAASINPKDVLLRKGRMRFLAPRLPRIPGFDIAGTLLDDAPGLPAGSPIWGMIQDHAGGACAQVVRLPPDQIDVRPRGLSAIEAAALPLVSLTALQALRDELELQAGQTVLINGASGGVGTVAVQIARALGARVVGVCSGRNRALVEGLGAERVIDYTQQEPAAERGLDAVFDCYGNLPWPIAKPMLTPSGRYCTALPKPGSVWRGLLRRIGLSRAALVVVRSRAADLATLRQMVESGQLKPIVEAELPWTEAAEAHRRIETRRTRGKIVLRIGD